MAPTRTTRCPTPSAPQASCCCAARRRARDIEIEYEPTSTPGGRAGARLERHRRVDGKARAGGHARDAQAAKAASRSRSTPASTSTSCWRTAKSALFRSPPRRRLAIASSCRSGAFRTAASPRRFSRRMKVGDRLRFEGPLGSFFLREDSEKPIIFVAGSTGFAPVKSMVEYAFARGMKRKMLLYWGTRRPADMYLAALPEQWAREHDNFSFVPVLSEPHPEDHWDGRTGLVHEAILEDFPESCRIPGLRLRLGRRWSRRRTRRSVRAACRRTTASRMPSASRRASAPSRASW